MTPGKRACQLGAALLGAVLLGAALCRHRPTRPNPGRRVLSVQDVVTIDSTLERMRDVVRSKQIRETDLYPPIAEHLGSLGYTVRSEVANCDITAARGDELIIVELKRNFSTELLIQAAKRQRMTDSVYVALPRQKNARKLRGMKHLLRRLELGLIFVSLNGRKKSRVEVAFHPVPFQRQKRKSARRAVLREISERSGDFNEAGCCRRKLVTAYRENAIQIACCLDRLGPLSPKQLRALDTGPKTLSILYSNFYGWFERIDRGVYALSTQGQTELSEYAALVRRYARRLAKAAPATDQPPT